MTSGEAVRARMARDLGRVATPAIVIGKRVFWGFEDNRAEIAELLGVSSHPPAAAHADDEGADPLGVDHPDDRHSS